MLVKKISFDPSIHTNTIHFVLLRFALLIRACFHFVDILNSFVYIIFHYRLFGRISVVGYPRAGLYVHVRERAPSKRVENRNFARRTERR